VNGVIWHQLCDATLWIQLLCNPASLQPVSLWGHRRGARVLTGGPLATPKNRLCELAAIYSQKRYELAPMVLLNI